jgi:hypothetical protein
MFGLERYFLIGTIVASLVGGAYVYVSWQSSEIQTLTKDNVRLTEVAERNAIAVRSMKAQVAKQRAENKELEAALNKSEETREEMLRIFRDHDLTNLATQKPGLIEKRINDGTRKAFDDLESITSN